MSLAAVVAVFLFVVTYIFNWALFPAIMPVTIGQKIARMLTSRPIVTVTCTPSANYCTIGSSALTTRTTSGPTTRTTTETVTKTSSPAAFPDVLSVFLGIIVVIVLGVILIVASRKPSRK